MRKMNEINRNRKEERALRRKAKLRLRQGLSVLLAACMITCTTNLQMVTALADEVTEGQTTEGEAVSGISGSEGENSPGGSSGESGQGQESGNKGSEGGIHEAEGSSQASGSEGRTETPSGSSEGENSSGNSTEGGSENMDEGSTSESGSGDAGESGQGEGSSESGSEEVSGSENTGNEPGDSGSEGGAASSEGIAEDSDAENGSSGLDGSDSDGNDDWPVLGENAESSDTAVSIGSGDSGSVEDDDSEPVLVESAEHNSGSGSGFGGGAGSAAAEDPAAVMETVTPDDLVVSHAEDLTATQEDPQGPKAGKAEAGNRYRVLNAEVYGGTEVDEYGELIVPEIRLIGRLPEGVYAVAYHEDFEDEGTLPEGQFVLESYDITIYDQSDTSYEIAEDEPVLIEFISPTVEKADEKKASLYAWYQDNWGGDAEEVIRNGREIDKDIFFGETKDGVVIDNFNLSDAEDVEGMLKKGDSENSLGYAVVNSSGAVSLDTVASPSDYTETYVYEDDEDELALEEKEAEELYKSFDKIRLNKKAYKFEYTGFGVYAITTDNPQLRPVTEQSLEAEIYADAALTRRDDSRFSFKITGMMPEGAIVKAWPEETPAELSEKEEELLLGAYGAGIFCADGTRYIADTEEDAESLMYQVEISSREMDEAVKADRQIAVLRIPSEADVYSAEPLVPANILTPEETSAKLEELKAARYALDAESRRAFDREAAFLERFGIDPVKIENEQGDPISPVKSAELQAQMLTNPAEAIRDMKSANNAILNVQQNAKFISDPDLADAADMPEEKSFEEARLERIEKAVEHLPDSVRDAVLNAAFMIDSRALLETKNAEGTYLILAVPEEKEAEFLYQEVEASVYTGEDMSLILPDVSITVRGELPVNASAYAYPVEATNGTSDETLIAYQIHILDETGEIIHSEEGDGRSIIVSIYDPLLAEYFADRESSTPVRGWHREDDDIKNMAYAVREDGSVQFKADEY